MEWVFTFLAWTQDTGFWAFFLGGRGGCRGGKGEGGRELKFSTQAVILARNLISEPVSRSNNPVGPLL